MIHPHTIVKYIDEEKGRGLFATKRIPRGTITWTIDQLDRVYSAAEIETYPPLYQEILMKYSFRNKLGEFVFCWDNGRFINHSFDSNCCLTPYDFEISIRDIEEGEELTDDYGYLNIIEPFDAQPQGSERTTVYPDDLLSFSDYWDARLQLAFPRIWCCDQPLLPFLIPEVTTAIEAIKKGDTELPSIKTCYYGGDK